MPCCVDLDTLGDIQNCHNLAHHHIQTYQRGERRKSFNIVKKIDRISSNTRRGGSEVFPAPRKDVTVGFRTMLLRTKWMEVYMLAKHFSGSRLSLGDIVLFIFPLKGAHVSC